MCNQSWELLNLTIFLVRLGQCLTHSSSINVCFMQLPAVELVESWTFRFGFSGIQMAIFAKCFEYRHTLFYWILLYCASQVLHFYKLKATHSTSKKIATHFIAILALLRWSGTKASLSRRSACTTCKALCEVLDSSVDSAHIKLLVHWDNRHQITYK